MVTFPDRPLRRGFALIDVVVAGIILAVALGALVSLSGRAVRSAQQSEELATAAMLADEQLQLVLSRGADDYAKQFPVEGACDEPFAAYTYRLEFSGGASAGEPYTVRATIFWGAPVKLATSSGPGGDARSLSIETLIAPRQIGADVEAYPSRRPEQPLQRGAQ